MRRPLPPIDCAPVGQLPTAHLRSVVVPPALMDRRWRRRAAPPFLALLGQLCLSQRFAAVTCTLAELAALLRCSPGTAGRLVEELEAAGWIERERRFQQGDGGTFIGSSTAYLPGHRLRSVWRKWRRALETARRREVSDA